MKIAILSPLYPPEIAPAAQYTKELARRLSCNHSVTILTYSSIPEEIAGVTIITIPKSLPLPRRLFSFFRAIPPLKDHCMYVINGPATEGPVAACSLFISLKLIGIIGDKSAHARSAKDFSYSLLERFFLKRCLDTITTTPSEKPEILPLNQYPLTELEQWEKEWEYHIKEIERKCQHVI